MPPPVPVPGDDVLAERALGGSEEALLELYARYRPRLMGYAFRMTGDRALAEDVFQSTFLYFFRNLERYERRGKLEAYLFRIARSELADERHAIRRARGEAAPPPAPGPAYSPDPEVEAKVRAALLELSPELREVVVLRVYDGLDYARIAEVTGTGEATARSRMRYALESLRKTLGPDQRP
jgi:RNA polymerase sigma-70 factor (ECF subfamily)